MGEKIISTIITFIVSGVLGYCVSILKNFRKHKNAMLEEFKQIKESQMADMKADLANKFFVYDTMEAVEDYLVISFREKCERYFAMGGDSYIHPMYDKSIKWKVKPTGYLK